VAGIHLFALEGQNEMPYWEANQRLALDWAYLNEASPGSSPTPLEVGVEWHYSFGRSDSYGCSITAGMENHHVVMAPFLIGDAQGQSTCFSGADREAESLTGLPGGASIDLGFDGAPNPMVHCFSFGTSSFFAEASCHQPFSSSRFYLITDDDKMPTNWECKYGLNPLDPGGVNGAEGDPDGDGFSNLQEYWNHTVPRDMTSHP